MKTEKTMDLNKMGLSPLTQDELTKANGGAILTGPFMAGFAVGTIAYNTFTNYWYSGGGSQAWQARFATVLR
jgi:hypothetical protein